MAHEDGVGQDKARRSKVPNCADAGLDQAMAMADWAGFETRRAQSQAQGRLRGIGLAALHVKYRDVRFVVPFLVQLWLFATPVAYPSSLLPAALRPWYGLNPMVGVVEGLRWAVLGTPPPDPTVLALSLATALVALVAGTVYFRRVEIGFADVV